MYRLTKKAIAQRQKLAAMQRGKAAARMARQAPDYLPELPDLRRRIVISLRGNPPPSGGGGCQCWLRMCSEAD
jgi:hypothetical protein